MDENEMGSCRRRRFMQMMLNYNNNVWLLIPDTVDI